MQSGMTPQGIVQAALVVVAAATFVPSMARADAWPPAPLPLPAECASGGTAAAGGAPVGPRDDDPCRLYRISVGTVSLSALTRTDSLYPNGPPLAPDAETAATSEGFDGADSDVPPGYRTILILHGDQTERYVVPIDE
jgi:hypothetical protein